MQKVLIGNMQRCGDKIANESQGVKSTVQRVGAQFSV